MAENPLEPNATAPQGPGQNETPPAEKPGGPGDIARGTPPPTGLSAQDQKRLDEHKRATDDEAKKRAELTGSSGDEGEPSDAPTTLATAPVEPPAQTLKGWRAT